MLTMKALSYSKSNENNKEIKKLFWASITDIAMQSQFIHALIQISKLLKVEKADSKFIGSPSIGFLEI